MTFASECENSNHSKACLY